MTRSRRTNNYAQNAGSWYARAVCRYIQQSCLIDIVIYYLDQVVALVGRQNVALGAKSAIYDFLAIQPARQTCPAGYMFCLHSFLPF